jgi:phosphate transport system permease protein
MNLVVARRKAANAVASGLAAMACAVTLVCLVWIFHTLLARGLGGLDAAFFNRLPQPWEAPGGGIANALAGTALLTGSAVAMGLPAGLLAGIYLAEYGRDCAVARSVRFVSDVLTGIPSIVVGVVAYALLVRPMGRFSGIAGAAALAVLMLPVVTRTTEEMLAMVPGALRESASALGAPAWTIVFRVSLRAALPGIMTGVLLAVARVTGETAALLLTAFDSQHAATRPTGPTASLAVTTFALAMSPRHDRQQLAWTAALVLTAAVLLLTIVARMLRPKVRWQPWR